MGSMGGAAANHDKHIIKVKVSNRQPVAAALPMQERRLPLSNLDLLLPPVGFSVFFFYSKNTEAGGNIDDGVVVPPFPAFGSVVGALKASLAQVMVSYYVFSGEVVANSAGEPELICNNSGADFVQAAADVRLEQLDLYNTDESIEGKLVPSLERRVLAVQATELVCGGVVVGCTFDHRIADAYSANMFLASWAEICRSSTVSTIPCHRRSLLHPRHSSIRQYLDLVPVDELYVCLSELPPPPPPESPSAGELEDRLVSRIYYVPGDEILKLQQLASSGNCKASKLVSFSSFLWKMMAKSASPSYNSDNNGNPVAGGRISTDGDLKTTTTSRMGIAVDGRSRLPGDMPTYFGNVLSIAFGKESISDLAEKPLSWIASGVRDFLRDVATEEHFLGLIDWVEAHRPNLAQSRMFCKETESGGPAFVVSSGLGFMVAATDFGWGRPMFSSYYFPWGGEAGYVMPMQSPHGNGDWIVYTYLLES
ncbi:hypothetical protein SAY87_002646 [Trapa incisa]|uniref:Uncharacterized protein n=1 Tax=Trapa incisa TaxID=236973 RepID=A0AAN7JX18_9MYRT|nr:hypothetical protein SAY87_002646 [Trapa incisa]